MNDFNQQPAGAHSSTDVGLRNFMLGTYRYMAMAMGVAGIVAYFFAQYLSANPELLGVMFGNWIMPVVFFGAVIFGFGIVGRKLASMSKGAMLAFLFGMAAMLGAFSAPVALFYNPMIVAKVFFMTTALFASLSLFGYTTEKDLWKYAKLAIPVFIGFAVLMLLGSIFPAMAFSGTLEIVLLVVGLLALSVLVAWETQALKAMYYGSLGNANIQQNLSIFGAASLLLSFYNMFHILLSLFGNE